MQYYGLCLEPTQTLWDRSVGLTSRSNLSEMAMSHRQTHSSSSRYGQAQPSDAMEVFDFGGTHYVHSIAELERLLEARYKNQMNEFALYPEGTDHPSLVIYVKDDLAVIFYHSLPEDPGYMSIGGKINLDPQKMTTFSIDNLDPGESIDIWNDFIVPFAEAVTVAKEFFHSQERPRSIEWFALSVRK
jgi:hypothetical protein